MHSVAFFVLSFLSSLCPNYIYAFPLHGTASDTTEMTRTDTKLLSPERIQAVGTRLLMMNIRKLYSPPDCPPQKEPTKQFFLLVMTRFSSEGNTCSTVFNQLHMRRKLNDSAQDLELGAEASKGQDIFVVPKKPSTCFKLIFLHLLLTKMMPGW